MSPEQKHAPRLSTIAMRRSRTMRHRTEITDRFRRLREVFVRGQRRTRRIIALTTQQPKEARS